MLHLTPDAAAHIRRMQQRAVDHGGDAGSFVRISRHDGSREAGVRLSFVRLARDDDQLGESQGIAMCIGNEVAGQLDGLVLDRRPGDATGLYIRAAS